MDFCFFTGLLRFLDKGIALRQDLFSCPGR